MEDKKVTEIFDQARLDQFLDDYPYVCIDFYAKWCGPCKRIAPEIENLAESWSSKGVKFLKVNTDSSPELSDDYDINSLPTFLFIDSRHDEPIIVARVEGANIQKILDSLCNLTGTKLN